MSRRSYQTGEFWLAVAFMLCGFSFGVYAISQDADLLGVAAIITAISTPIATWIFGRNKFKESNASINPTDN